MYCSSCGSSNPDQARFCVSCGAVLQQSGAATPPPTVGQAQAPGIQVAAGTAAATTERTGCGAWLRGLPTKLLLLALGLFLIVYGTRTPVLMFVGQDAVGTVTEVDRSSGRIVDFGDGNASYNDYDVSYEFTTADGAIRGGSFTRYDVYDTTELPRVGGAVDVHYLQQLPYLNAPADEGPFALMDIILAATGLLMVVGSVFGLART